jgi:hypothetical protein
VGFMDKAKKLAEQAQQKLDEAQTQFNQSAAPQGGQAEGGGIQYDEHGRPIQQTPPPAPNPAAGAPPAPAPTAPAPTEPAGADAPPAGEPAAEQAEVTETPQAPSPTGDSNATPDPFKPLQQ